MLQTINDKLKTLLGGVKLDPRLGLGLMAALAGLLAIGVVFYLWRDQGAMRSLYGAGEAYPAAEVMQVLDADKIAYQLHPQSGQILVREADLGRARMLLSAKGVQVAVPAGYDLFDKDEPLGTSQFVQDVRLKRSLEGELARTIMALKGIDNARVHLAMQESSSFVVSNREPAKASVMLQMSPGARLQPEQVGAIVNLLANSVPKLQAKDVSVVDQYGALLSRGLNMDGAPAQSWQLVEEYQQKASSNVEQVLAPILGHGNYRISVTADIDFSQKEETVQAFGDTPRLRNEVLQDESVLDQLALGVPGSLSNRPPTAAQAQPAAGARANTADKGATSIRKESTRKLDYDQSVTHVKYSPFSLRSQSIAVVLNGTAEADGGWSPQARTELETMLKSAVGFNSSRGDVLTLSVFPFAAGDMTVEQALWWQDDKLHQLVKIALFGLISLLLLLMVVRPALGRLLGRKEPVLLPEVQGSGELHQDSAMLPQPLQKGIENSNFATMLGETNPLSEICLPAPGSGLELQIEHLQMLAKNDPERVSEVIKQWIGRNETNVNPA
ncbi:MULTISPECIES: flagellar basal-body MS-ring/collar protein FliF [Pseudomonas]|uniref:flagellar basal-body MS-ring/collar protein FliF n=1 Tax=Pseudomonas TaxID=286 RepID=UPI000BA222D5|nr:MULTISPECIES: flagellar basal-body MS-ring/collar protein FliF [Pseudomonas]AOA08965.1 flagellar M-ring protein FliF [Pseudomonas sp. TMW 2.1634]PAA27457.1 flagellar M-ring protein FliF [Pseudomonas fragi]